MRRIRTTTGLLIFVWMLGLVCLSRPLRGDEPRDVWPELAPGESTRLLGDVQPPIPAEKPPVTRVMNITRPTFTVHPAAEPSGVAMLILPGGGFSKVVPDKEGTEAAEWLNSLGITAFVLSYRTTTDPHQPGWLKPMQDAQRALAVIRSEARHWNIEPDKIGLLGFSAGGQVAARLLAADGDLAYEPIDEVDDLSHRPNFTLLIYPWNLYDKEQNGLVEGVRVHRHFPPTFLVHTHDDRSSSLGTVLLYAELRRHSIPAELHVFATGGHGYGLRPVKGSRISTWPEQAAHWLHLQGLTSSPHHK